MVEALEYMRYDAVVIGNHEFDWGVQTLQKLHDRTTLTLLGANIYTRADKPNPLRKVKPFIVKTVDGVRVALAGLTTPAIPSWIRPYLLKDILFSGSIEALREVMPLVRAQIRIS